MQWENFKTVSIKDVPLPPFLLVFNGWKEEDHTSLTDTKKQIEYLYSTTEWEIRKKITNPYEVIFSSPETKYPCITKKNVLSRSYFKMVEMLKVFDCLSDYSEKKLQTVHICEGPGGFIQALIDITKEKNFPLEHLFAMTLKPTKSYIPGWRRSTQFLKENPIISLQYGQDGTGDILNIDNQKSFVGETLKTECKTILFTADGGFDFSIDYSQQEQNVFPLLLASFLLGLQTLSEDGVMIIKLFDMYSQVTKDLVLGTATFFKEFCIYKPATSRPCNSERYFVAKGYVGSSNKKVKEWIKYLQQIQQKNHNQLTSLFKVSWHENIIDCLDEQINWQEKLQMDSISETLHFKKSNIEDYLIKSIHSSKKWCEYFRIPYSL